MGKKKHKAPAEEPPVEGRSEFAPLLGAIAAAILLTQLVLRLLISDVEAGNDFLLSGIVWLAAGVYFTARGIGGDGTFRFSGVELPLMFFCILGLLAVQEAPYFFGAQRIIAVWVSNALMCVVLVDWMHRRGTARVWTLVSATAFMLLIYGVLQNIAILPALMDDPRVTGSQAMVARTGSFQPFGTFAVSNTFAGFIAVILPMAYGSMLDARALAGKRPFWMSPNAVLRGMFLILAVVVLAMTESRGGIVAAAAGLGSFFVLLWARGRGWSRKPLALGAAGVALAAVVAVSAGGMGALKRFETFRLRAEAYWPAAVKMIDESPWRGLGLGSYEDHYPRLKPEIQTYVRQTHNDYLQIAAEIGVPGAILFGMIWLVALWRGARGDAPDPPTAPPARGIGALAAVGVVAFALEYGLSGLFADNLDAGPAVAIAMAVCWLVYAAFTHEANAAPGPGFGLGALAGIVAYLVHATVDFDFTSSVFSHALFVVLALALVRTVKLGYLPLPRPAGTLMALACFACGVFMVGFFAPTVQAADARRRAAEEKLREAGALPASESDPPLREAKRLLWSRAYEEGEDARPGAFDLNDRDAETLMLIARVYWFDYAAQIAMIKTPDEAHLVEQGGLFDAAIDALFVLLQGEPPVRSTDANAWFFGGMMHVRRYDHFMRMASLSAGETRSRFEGMANSSLTYAEQYLSDAVMLYPSYSRHRAWMARVQDLKGERDRAREHARKAKEYHEASGDDPQFKLSGEELGWVEAILK